MTVSNTTRSYTDCNLPFSKHLGPEYVRIALGLLMKKTPLTFAVVVLMQTKLQWWNSRLFFRMAPRTDKSRGTLKVTVSTDLQTLL